MTRPSPPDLLALHAVRLLGLADLPAITARFDLAHAEAEQSLHAAEARHLVQHTSFAGLEGWFLTDGGKAENERRLAEERALADPGDVIGSVYADLLPLNARLLRACTDWQLRPADGDTLAANDHGDPDWDADILEELARLHRSLVPLVDRLTGILARFGGYDTRFAAALHRAYSGEHGWVDRTDVDSCHRVWFQLHEDLVATKGIDRRAER